MVLYFSGTGNCEYVANFIAKAINDKAISILNIEEEIILKDNERLGIVTPTYFWGLPSIVERFLKNINIQAKGVSYIYCVVTYGSTSGQVDGYIKKLFKKKDIELSASYGIKTVDNYTVWFDVNDKNKIQEILKAEEEQLNGVLEKIKTKQNCFISKDKKSKFMCLGAKACYQRARKTKNFNVDENCISCGLCARECPENAIKIENGRPKWIKEKCTLCFRCLHKCPKFAINYKNKTQKNGQYIHP